MIYGVHEAYQWIRPTGYLVVVEGESDLHTAWHHDLPALGLPGATIGHKALAAAVKTMDFRTIYVVPDSDLAGREMLRRTWAAFRRTGFSGDVLAVPLPAKDLSDLHCEAGGDFDAAIGAAFEQAKPAEQAINEAPRTDKTALRAIGRVLERRDLNATDKVIVTAAIQAVAGDLSAVLPLQNEMILAAGIPRSTYFDRMPRLIEQGYFSQGEDGRLQLGKALRNPDS